MNSDDRVTCDPSQNAITPLHLAAAGGYDSTVTILLGAGANVDAKGKVRFHSRRARA